MISENADTSSRGCLNSTIGRCRKRPNPSSGRESSRRSSIVRHDRGDRGYTVDLGDLLFTPYRHFLITNNGRRVWVDELKGKTVVLFIVPIDRDRCMEPAGDTLDMIQAYRELLPLGGIEFVFVPVYIPNDHDHDHDRNKDDHDHDCCARFNDLFSSLPFPAVPFSDIEACGDRLVHTFSVTNNVSYWVIVDPTSTVVATRARYRSLFKLFGGAELYPLSLPRIRALYYDFEGADRVSGDMQRRESRKRLIRKWDQLLASPTRDFLLSSNGDRVPISSLKGKVIGLYFCENRPYDPPRMEAIKEAYREAKLRGYDFEIVQINYHYQIHYDIYPAEYSFNFSEQRHYEDINWLTLPFKDPSCRKLHRIFECSSDLDCANRMGDCLVIVDSRRQTDEVIFEFCGAEIIDHYGIQGYPFTRQSLIENEYTRHRKEIKLLSLFPPGLCQFTRRRAGRDGFDLVNDSELKGKRVLVLFAKSYRENSRFISMLKSKYCEQAEKDKFEVVYVSTDECESEYNIPDMPWLVYPYSQEFRKRCSPEIFKFDSTLGAAAFDINGQLISKKYLNSMQGQMEHQFPFFSGDLRGSIEKEVQNICNFLDMYYREY